MDPLYNCILQVCCDFADGSGKRQKAMARLLEQHGMSKADAEKHAQSVLDAWQPVVDHLQPFIAEIAKLARGPAFKE
jgi:hypothetical protein